jgi:membrane dipeptidase
VVDLHVDLSYQLNYKKRPFDRGSGQFVADELERAGVVGVVLPLYIPREVSPEGPRGLDLESSYARVLGSLIAHAVYSPPGCVGGKGRVRTWLAFEGATPLRADAQAVTSWVARGVRLFGLVHTYDNQLATSSGPRAPARSGLTEAGRALAERVHALGAFLDVSHASDRTVSDVLELARRAGAPVVASHSNSRSITPHRRNLSDQQVRAIAQTGGIIGVNFHSAFLAEGRRATLEDVVRHIRHLVAVAGVDHVAIGSDFEGDIRPPAELASATRFQSLAQALLKVGMTRRDVESIFHRNALKLLCKE